jgi:hypothetical protein
MAKVMNSLSKDQITEAAPVKAAAFKIRGACQYLGGISEITLRRLIARGLIKPNRSLRHILIPISELDRFLSK